ncbi:peptidylprolyl isomerase [Marivirga sp. S37H4]|uniref:Peptidylprolyl isomerase n=1 Tax=Marivirga aurantiaca TaxID=2802615 RepID=A0A934X222_9BACT|nr:peptidylprolyl isomerase [Marivirga aurantiaca]MBK6267047.1 peptidylprolyl isomerase [Marivirga aurantiaca]
MRYFILLLILPILFVSCKPGQTNTESKSEKDLEPLFTINETKVYPGEFMYAYEKSNKNKGETEALEDYLELYINFKLKVEDAKKAGLDTLPSYQNELKGYLQDIKKPYLATEQVTENLIQETYERLQEEINASHILIMVEENASAEDTLKAYQKINDIRKKYLAGESFEKLARQDSEDPSAKNNSGELGWFTAFQMVYPFESTAYNTPEGEISDIVRTKFGYHIIKVNAKRETLGRIKLAHIMIRYPEKANSADSAATYKKIQDIYEELMREDQSWFALATEYSEDLNTKNQGGSLPWFGAGNLPPGLEKAAFDLTRPNEISKPVESPYGWHILKLEEKRGVGSLESMEESLTRRIQRDQRSELKISEVLETLKKENNFRKNEASYSYLKKNKNLTDSLLTDKNKNEVLFYIADEAYTLDDFFKDSKKKAPLDEAIYQFEKKMLLAYENRHLPQKYPEYKMLATEYRDGLLLFEIMSKKVWDKVSSDSIGLKKYYEEHQEQYTSDPMVKADIFTFSDTSNINTFKAPVENHLYYISNPIEWQNKKELNAKIDLLKWFSDTVYVQLKGPKQMVKSDSILIFSTLSSTFKKMESMDPIYSDENKIYLHLLSKANDGLLKIYNNLNTVQSGEYVIGETISGMTVPKDRGHHQSFNNDGHYQIINVKESIPERLKTFEESKPELISDYQTHLENEWIEQLKQENKVIVNKVLLQKLKREAEEQNL